MSGLFNNLGGGGGGGTTGGGGALAMPSSSSSSSLFSNLGGGGGGSGGGSLSGGSGSGGLFSNLGGGGGTGGGSGSLLSGGGGGSGGGLFSNLGGGTSGGSGGLLSSGGGSGSLLGGGLSSNYSINSNTALYEKELQQVLDEFRIAYKVDQANPGLRLKAPVYDLIPQNYQPSQFWQYGYTNLYDQRTWEEYQKNNPDKNRYFVGCVIGIDNLQKRFQEVAAQKEKLAKTLNDLHSKIDKMSKEHSNQFQRKTNELRQRNHLLIGKLLSVHGVIENIALQCNEYNRRPNEEMYVFNKFQQLENYPNEMRTKLLDIRSKSEGLKTNNNQKYADNEFSANLPRQSKERMIEIMTNMKNGIEKLEKLTSQDQKDFRIMENYLQANRNV